MLFLCVRFGFWHFYPFGHTFLGIHPVEKWDPNLFFFFFFTIRNPLLLNNNKNNKIEIEEISPNLLSPLGGTILPGVLPSNVTGSEFLSHEIETTQSAYALLSSHAVKSLLRPFFEKKVMHKLHWHFPNTYHHVLVFQESIYYKKKKNHYEEWNVTKKLFTYMVQVIHLMHWNKGQYPPR